MTLLGAPSPARGHGELDGADGLGAYSAFVALPPIRYVHTDEGVSIAYTVFGEGSPLLYSFAGPGLSNFEHEWNLPGLVEQYEAMSEEHAVVRFDWRNCGLSTRRVADVSPAAHLRDLIALQDHLGFERVALRVHGSAPIAIRYAASARCSSSSVASHPTTSSTNWTPNTISPTPGS